MKEVFPAITSSYHLLYMLDKSCNLEEIIYEIITWCLNGNCSPATLLENILNTLF